METGEVFRKENCFCARDFIDVSFFFSRDRGIVLLERRGPCGSLEINHVL